MTEESLWPPACAPNHFNLSRLLSPLTHIVPSATVSVVFSEAPVVLDPDTDLNVHTEGPWVES